MLEENQMMISSFLRLFKAFAKFFYLKQQEKKAEKCWVDFLIYTNKMNGFVIINWIYS